MSFGEDQAVTVGPFGVFGIVTQEVEIKECQNIRARQRTARMSRAGNAEHLDNVTPDRQSGLGKSFPVDFLFTAFNVCAGLIMDFQKVYTLMA